MSILGSSWTWLTPLSRSMCTILHPLPIEDDWLHECRRYVREMAAGDGYLHMEIDVSHRDLKPDNILLKKEGGADLGFQVS